MLSRTLSLVALACLTALVVAADKPTPIKPIKMFKGRIDKDQQKESPKDGVIANAKDLEKLWKAWKIKDEMPKVDFDKELVLVVTSSTSGLRASATLDDKGDVKVLSLATRDIRDDFAFNILVISRTGVKTINGKDIPK
jgi:hypothetical protein